VGFIGAGNYASVHLLPHVKSNPVAHLRGLVCSTGPSAKQKSLRWGFEYCSTNVEDLLSDAVDVFRSICGSPITSVHATGARSDEQSGANADNVTLTLTFENGSLGVLNYSTLGCRDLPKERLEVFGGGRVAVLDDFTTLELLGGPKPTKIKSGKQDKGQPQQVAATLQAFRDKRREVIPIAEIVEVMAAILLAQKSLADGTVQRVVASDYYPSHPVAPEPESGFVAS